MDPPIAGSDADSAILLQEWRFGTHVIDAGYDPDSVEIRTELTTTAQALFSRAVMGEGPIEYRGELTVGTTGWTRYRGWVVRVTVGDDGVHVLAQNGLQLEEHKLGGLAHANMTPVEVIWALGRTAGIDEAHFRIEGGLVLDRTPEKFEVTMPVSGVATDGDLELGPVTITSDKEAIERKVAFVGSADLRRDFLAPGAWAVTTVDAGLTLEAEERGAAVIRGVLDRVALEAQYSLAYSPDGAVLPFDRDALFADPTAEPVVLAIGGRTGRRWFRVQREPRHTPPLADRRVRLQAPSVGSDARFDEALRAWRRAVRATDAMDAVGALWEAIEFYASETGVSKLFSRTKLAEVEAALTALDLTEAQRQRLSERVKTANEAPLLIRLRRTLERDGVPFSDAEIEVLRRLRDRRNDVVHGRGRGEPIADDLDMAKGFVNRMIAFRAKHRGPQARPKTG